MLLEAEYTFRLRKPIIPLRLQPGYNPDGWLGALAGSKLVFDCSLPSKLEESVKNLIKELGTVGKVDSSKLMISVAVGFINYYGCDTLK